MNFLALNSFVDGSVGDEVVLNDLHLIDIKYE